MPLASAVMTWVGSCSLVMAVALTGRLGTATLVRNMGWAVGLCAAAVKRPRCMVEETFMSYRAPVGETVFFLDHCTSLPQLAGKGGLSELSTELAAQVLEEAGKFANERIAPLNRIGDREGTLFENGVVTMPKGWKEAYRAFAEAGWLGLPAPV